MHPKQICKDFEAIGSPIIVEGNDLYINNPENVYPELEELAKSYKSSLIKYLKGDYTDKQYSIEQTIEKIITYYVDLKQPSNQKIEQWLNNDYAAVELVIKLCKKFWDNGWQIEEPFVNYSDSETDEVSEEIYERAMAFFRGG